MPSSSGTVSPPSDPLGHQGLSHPPPRSISEITKELDITELGVRYSGPVSLGTSPCTAEAYPQFVWRRDPPPPREHVHAVSLLGEYDRLMIAACAVIALQAQLLASGQTSTTTRAVLTFGMTTILIAIFFLECGQYFEQYLCGNVLGLLASRVPKTLILMGVVGLAGTLVVETFKMCWGIALILAGIFIFGVVVCVLFSWHGNRGKL